MVKLPLINFIVPVNGYDRLHKSVYLLYVSFIITYFSCLRKLNLFKKFQFDIFLVYITYKKNWLYLNDGAPFLPTVNTENT